MYVIYTAKDQIEMNDVNLFSLDVHKTNENIYFYERVQLEQYHSCSGIGVNSSAAYTADIYVVYIITQRDSRERSCADEL